jgi:hypothetical protein
VIDGTSGAVPVTKTLAAIQSKIAELKGVNPEKLAPVINELESWARTLGGKSLRGLEENRKILGDSFLAPELSAVKKYGTDALNPIYGALREDMGDFIKNVNPAHFSRWKFANDQLSKMADDLKVSTLKSVLRTGKGTPEDVTKLLFSQKPSVVKLLYSGLSDTGKAQAQAAILQRALEKSGGVEALSPDSFASQIGKLGNQMGVFFKGDDLARVQGLHRVLTATQRAAQANLHPPTGVQGIPYMMGAGLTSLFGLVGGVASAGGIGLLARAYESAPVRNALIVLSRTKPGSKAEETIMKRTEALIAATASAARSKGAPGALNDNIPAVGSVAASPDQRPDNPDQQTKRQ